MDDIRSSGDADGDGSISRGIRVASLPEPSGAALAMAVIAGSVMSAFLRRGI